MITDNSTAEGFANDRNKIKRSKANDMRFWWIQDRVKQGQFIIKGSPGSSNISDYHTKHHPTLHHIKMRPTFLHIAALLTAKASDCKGVLIPGLTLSQLLRPRPPGLSPVTTSAPSTLAHAVSHAPLIKWQPLTGASSHLAPLGKQVFEPTGTHTRQPFKDLGAAIRTAIKEAHLAANSHSLTAITVGKPHSPTTLLEVLRVKVQPPY